MFLAYQWHKTATGLSLLESLATDHLIPELPTLTCRSQTIEITSAMWFVPQTGLHSNMALASVNCILAINRAIRRLGMEV